MNRIAGTASTLLLAAAMAAPAGAQVGVPALPLPRLPAVEDTVPRALAAAGAPLKDLRRLRVDALLAGNRDLLERDPDGQPAVRGQVTALSPAPQALERALAAGFVILDDTALGGLGLRVVVLRAPQGLSTRRALRRLRSLDPQGVYDYNHIYTGSGEAVAAPAADSTAPAAATHPDVRIGLIDSGVDSEHPALAGIRIERHGCAGSTLPAAHGTAVASLLAGRSPGFVSAAPGAVLYAADIYCGVPTGGSAAGLAVALDWMARERVPVVNISLVGARNELVTGLVEAMAARGHLLVAAVGNDGPAAAPLYPAAYPQVVGVTAVDPGLRVLPEACRGAHVAFAAPGAEMRGAAPGAGWATLRGTSFATPLVAGLLASGLGHPDRELARQAVERLAATAIDRGPPGVDRDYGAGVVGAALRTPPLSPASEK